MRRSEKILLAILVGSLLAWQGWRLVDRVALGPIRRSAEEIERLDQQLAEQSRQSVALAEAESELLQWQGRSLPPDPLTAQRLYQQWLTDLAQDCGFEAPKVFPDRVTRRNNDACAEVLVSIDAEARLDQLCLFLSRFYGTNLAQHITLLKMDRTPQLGEPRLRVTIMAEGLALRDAQPRQRLFPSGTLAEEIGPEDTTVQVQGVDELRLDTTYGIRIGGEYLEGVRQSETQWSVQRGADHSTAAAHPRGELVEFIPRNPSAAPRQPSPPYASLVAGNPFSKPQPKVVERPPPPEETPVQLDPAEFTYLVAAFAQDDRRQAWLYDRLENATTVLSLGQPFTMAGIEGRVETIEDNSLVFESRQSRWRVRLGQNLRSMERLPATSSE